MNRTFNSLAGMRIAQAVLLHQQNVQAEAQAGSTTEVEYTADAGPEPRTLIVDDTFVNRLRMHELDMPRIIQEGFHGVKTIRGPREGRKPTKAMKKAAKKERHRAAQP